MYSSKLSRSSCLVSSIIFMFCAPQIFHVYPGHLPELCTMIWLPLILLFSELFIRNRNKFTKTFLIMALITTILALGKVTPLFKILYTIVPGFNMFRGNCKFIFIVAFSLSVLSGIGAGYGTWHGIINKIYLEEATNIIDHNYRLNKI